MRALEESFGRNAANVEASSSKRASHLNASNVHTELSGLDGSDITTWSSSYNTNINLRRGRKSSDKKGGLEPRQRSGS